MQMVLNQFTKALAESRLMTTSEVSAFIDALPPDKQPDDGAALARELVRQKKLTKFQAQAIYQGKTKGLIMGDYVVLDRIGQGGMGQVYKAKHRVMERLVALKTLPTAATKSDRAVKRFHREVTVAARLSHPNIVTAHDAREDHGVHFLVMEYVEGSDLGHLVRKQGRLPVKTALDYILQAAKGLEYAHAENVIHRDIKPSNLLLDKHGTIKILDMGLARLNQEIGPTDSTGSDTLTGTGDAMGTIDYMPPEQAENTKTVDQRADIYSLGCTLYSLLVGRPIYSGDTTVVKLLAHREATIPSLRAERPDVPEKLDAVFQKMVAKKPDDRYGSMSEVITELEAFTGPTPEQFSETTQYEAGAAHVATLPEEGHDESLPLDFPVISPIDDLLRTRPKPDRKQQILFVAGAVGAFLVVFLFGVILSARTPDGTLIVEINEPDAVVSVLDEKGKVEITRKSENGPLSISVDPGKHRLKVEKSGFEFYTEDFVIESGGKKAIRARLGPVKEKRTVATSPSKAKTPLTAVSPATKVVESPEPVKTFEGQLSYSVSFNPHGSLLAFGKNGNVQLWNTGTWELREVTLRKAGIGKVAFSPDGSLLAVIEAEKGTHSLSLLEVVTGHVRWCVDFGHELKQDFVVVFSPHGSVLADRIQVIGSGEGTLEIRDATTGQLQHTVTVDGGCGLAFSPDGSILASGTSTGPQLWNVVTKKLEAEFFDPKEAVKHFHSVSYSPDGSMLATGHYNGTVRIWDSRSGEVRHRLKGQNTRVKCVAFRADGLVLASGSDEGTITLWDPLTGEEIVTFQAHWRLITEVEFSPTGRDLATRGFEGNSSTVKIWDVSKFLPPKPTFPPLAVAPFTPEEAKQHQQAWAKHLGVPVVETNSIGMKMVLIPPGEFMMGSTEEEIEELLREAEEEKWLNVEAAKCIRSEGPQHSVRITKPFHLAAHEVTMGQFKAFVEATRYKTEAETDGKGGSGKVEVAGKWEESPEFNWWNLGVEQTDQQPVINVTWNDAVAFCRWASEKEGNTYALPTEAQWEYACRAGSTTRWCFGGNRAKLEEYAWYRNHGGFNTKPVGQKLPSGFALFDMYGNVWERCSDWSSLDYYGLSPVDDPDGPSSGGSSMLPVLRGGAYCNSPGQVNSANRSNGGPSFRNSVTGFRPVQTIPTGHLTLNITEPNATISFDNGQSTFTTPDDAQPIETVLTEGKHTIEVSKAGFKTFKKEISVVADGRETLAVRLEAVRAAAGAADPDRRAAEWVLSVGGSFEYYDKKLIPATTLDDLPKGPFHINHVFLDHINEIEDADLDRLAGLKHLSQVQLHYSRKITDEGLKRLTTIGSLDALYLGGTRITDDGLRYLKQLPKLMLLHLSNSPITDTGNA